MWRPIWESFQERLVVSYGDMRLGQGRENAKEFLRQNQELCNEIESKVREKASLPGYHAPAEDDDGGKDYLDE